ncbi:hypothetical protein SLEP1_g52526 [Rubroshorea leprosula]|uniref:Uncharacterized protein n=1 Tax=Rubroshorea leprosula TaxID=152421 RepID=A0AAV5M7C6_9ROSI|nr:hypothetical protein SLEP1_g52526 [Rubroshorea leprosula]
MARRRRDEEDEELEDDYEEESEQLMEDDTKEEERVGLSRMRRRSAFIDDVAEEDDEEDEDDDEDKDFGGRLQRSKRWGSQFLDLEAQVDSDEQEEEYDGEDGNVSDMNTGRMNIIEIATPNLKNFIYMGARKKPFRIKFAECCCNLETLVLCGYFATERTFHNLISKFPLLENLWMVRSASVGRLTHHCAMRVESGLVRVKPRIPNGKRKKKAQSKQRLRGAVVEALPKPRTGGKDFLELAAATSKKKRQRRIELAKLVRPLRGVSRCLPNFIADEPLGKPQHNAFVNAFPACCPAFQTSHLLPMSPRRLHCFPRYGTCRRRIEGSCARASAIPSPILLRVSFWVLPEFRQPQFCLISLTNPPPEVGIFEFCKHTSGETPLASFWCDADTNKTPKPPKEILDDPITFDFRPYMHSTFLADRFNYTYASHKRLTRLPNANLHCRLKINVHVPTAIPILGILLRFHSAPVTSNGKETTRNAFGGPMPLGFQRAPVKTCSEEDINGGNHFYTNCRE